MPAAPARYALRPVRRLLPAIAAVLALAAAVPAAAQDEQRIAPGVSAGGVDLSNLTVPEATELLEQRLGPPLTRRVAVHVAGRRFYLTAREARQRFDAERTAKRAYYAGRDNPPSQPQGGGAAPGLVVPLAVRHSRAAVRAFAARVADAVRIHPRNATVRITVRRMIRRRARAGRALDAGALARDVDAAWDDPAARHKLLPRRTRIPARVNANDLAELYETVLTVDRSSFKLRLFKRLRHARTYEIAVGAAGVETPRGLYRITSRQVNPAWHVPRRPWAGALAGKVIPGGAPNNPLKARWLGITNGVGIHGTAEEWSIGSRASHGCIRMRVADVKRLYDRVPLGTRVLIR